MKLDIVKMGDIEYDPNIFIPMESHTPLDKVFSKQGGIMPATNYIVIGDPGIGKSTLSINYAAELQEQNPDKKFLFVSGEMTRVDMYGYLERFDKWKTLPTVFLSEFTEGRYKESIESLFAQGWDCIVLDSFAEINEAVKEDYNMFMGGKMSTSGAEKWLIDLFIKNNLAENDNKKHTSFISIQQVTKGGAFVGSNKLKHNTTGMIELRYTKSGERRINVSKNRRGFEYQDLHFAFNETGKGVDPIEFDVARIEREKELQGKINAERDQILNDERKLNALFGIDEGEEQLDEAIESAEVISQ
jgi:predicted ATP-dependent serine protease